MLSAIVVFPADVVVASMTYSVDRCVSSGPVMRMASLFVWFCTHLKLVDFFQCRSAKLCVHRVMLKHAGYSKDVQLPEPSWNLSSDISLWKVVDEVYPWVRNV